MIKFLKISPVLLSITSCFQKPGQALITVLEAIWLTLIETRDTVDWKHLQVSDQT